MPTNPYVNNYSNQLGAITREQTLLEDLIIETIKFYGTDVWYIPRKNIDQIDMLFGEQPRSIFDSAYKCEMYFASIYEFGGEKSILTKFGIEIREQADLIVARRSFLKNVPGLIRPREGDLIYFQLTQSLYEITFVDNESRVSNFHALGRQSDKPYMYELKIELFKFGNEIFSTGIDDIDTIPMEVAHTLDFTMASGAGNYHIYEQVTQTGSGATAKVKSWNPETKNLKVINIDGDFVASANIVGSNSSASWSYTVDWIDDEPSSIPYDLFDNKQIQQEADEIMDFTVKNPFGEP